MTARRTDLPRPDPVALRARLAALGWTPGETVALVYLVRWRGPGEVREATGEHVRLTTCDGTRLRWRRGYGLEPDDAA